MSENFKPRRLEEPETYVEDVDKAFYMANSNAKRHEEAAAQKRAFLNDLVNGDNYKISGVETEYGKVVVDYVNTDYATRPVRDKEGIGFHDVTSNLWPGSVSVIKNPHEQTNTEYSITSHQRQADEIYKVADAVYDVLKRTKR